jgi:hypothetical protein
MTVDKELRAFIEDLIVAVQNAAWLDHKGRPNLYGPTSHMRFSIENLRAVLNPRCPECNQHIKD